MTKSSTPAAVLLVLSGVSDIGAVPLMLSGHNRPPGAVAAGAIVFAVASIAAAVALTRGARWATPVGIGSRVLDLLGTMPVMIGVAGAGLAAAAAVTAALSLVAIGLLARLVVSRRSQVGRPLDLRT
jgi:hypothetical protein